MARKKQPIIDLVPQGTKIVGERQTALDGATVRMILEGWEVREQIRRLEERLAEIQAQLLQDHGVGCTLVVPGLCRVALSSRETVRISDPDRLAQVLGMRWEDLVRIQTTYRPEPRLVAMAMDADHPLRDDIAACLDVTSSTAVSWRAA